MNTMPKIHVGWFEAGSAVVVSIDISDSTPAASGLKSYDITITCS